MIILFNFLSKKPSKRVSKQWIRYSHSTQKKKKNSHYKQLGGGKKRAEGRRGRGRESTVVSSLSGQRVLAGASFMAAQARPGRPGGRGLEEEGGKVARAPFRKGLRWEKEPPGTSGDERADQVVLFSGIRKKKKR